MTSELVGNVDSSVAWLAAANPATLPDDNALNATGLCAVDLRHGLHQTGQSDGSSLQVQPERQFDPVITDVPAVHAAALGERQWAAADSSSDAPGMERIEPACSASWAAGRDHEQPEAAPAGPPPSLDASEGEVGDALGDEPAPLAPTGASRAVCRAMRSANWKGAEDRAQVVCQRLKKARQYNGYTLEEASARIGCGLNADTLGRIEAGEMLPRVEILVGARAAYVVTTDFLLGFVDNADAGEVECKSAALRDRIFAALVENAESVQRFMGQALGKGAPTVAMGRDLVEKSAGVRAALSRFRARNPEYPDMPAGALLETTIASLYQAERVARAAIVRFDQFDREALELEQQRLAEVPGSLWDADER
ncbi:MAG: helix-turn-helix transcriptional regulator [Nevskia sp.]|nr:helix-turn-helix transcriptional regulator [Nevskia sp.]